jgi:hypothetical protein
MKTKDIFFKVWGMPVLIAALSIFGLLSALLGDNIWDVLSWMSLGVPLLVISRFLLKQNSPVNPPTL